MKPDWRKRKKQGVLRRDREGSKIKGSGQMKRRMNGISLTKVENLESREICEEEEWV